MQWSIDLHPVTGEWRIIDSEGEIVCVSLHGEQYLAKIAAAPDMFEALKMAREAFVVAGSMPLSDADTLALIDAALAKATPEASDAG